MPQYEPKLCLNCARAKLAGRAERACGTCILLNADPLAKVRANSARQSPLARFIFPATTTSIGRGSTIENTQRRPCPTSWERGE